MTTRPRGRQAAALFGRAAETHAAYVAALATSDHPEQTRRTYAYRVRGYLAWLTETDVDGDPLTDRAAAVNAMRDYRQHLVTASRAPSTINASLAAAADLARHLGLGAWITGKDVQRIETSGYKGRPALEERDTTRLMRAAEAAGPRDRALAAILRHGGLRVAELVALDLADLPTTQRSPRLTVRGKGRRHRRVPVNQSMREAIEAWLPARAELVGEEDTPALFPGRGGRGRLTARAAEKTVARLARAAGIGHATPHQIRKRFGRDVVKAADIVTAADLLGHGSIETTRTYAAPTDADLDAAVADLPHDR